MTIRIKLIILVSGVFLLAFLSVFSYFAVTNRSGVYESERMELNRLREAVSRLDLAVNSIAASYLPETIAELDEAIAAADGAYASVSGLTALPKASPALAGAIKSILALREVTAIDVADLLVKVTLMDTASNRFFGTSEKINLFSFYADEAVRSNFIMNSTYKHIQVILQLTRSLNDALSSTVDTIASQQQGIDDEISKIRAFGILTALLLASVFMLTAVFFSLFLARSITKSIMLMEQGFGALGAGDLRQRLPEKGRDELARLCRDMNGFIDTLSRSLRGIQAASAESTNLRGELQGAVQESTASAVEISANSRSIADIIASLDGKISVAVEAMLSMDEKLRDLNGGINRQDRMMAASEVSLRSIIGGLDALAKEAEEDALAASRLGKASETGKIVFREAFDRVAGITESIGSIREMVDIIKGISAQTNLLAMNAAIEAAHAGEAGQGFSVVASEIRKLAELAGSSSKTIGQSISSVVARIHEASAVKDKTEQAFAEIEAEVARVRLSVSQIQVSVSGIRSLGTEVIGNTGSLLKVSVENAEGSSAIADAADKLKSAILEAERISTEVGTNISQIALGLADISRSSLSVSELADRSGKVGDTLQAEINWFKTS